MLFDAEPVQEETYTGLPETAVMVGFRFDWKENRFMMAAGTPVEVTGTEAVKAWLELVIRIRRGRYAIYPADFGAPVQELMGHRYPKGFDLSELRRQLSETAKQLPAIREISDVTYDGDTIQCTVLLETEAGETQEVIEIEP